MLIIVQQADKKNFTLISSLCTQDFVARACQEKWSVGTDGERESNESVLSVCFDHNDDVCIVFI